MALSWQQVEAIAIEAGCLAAAKVINELEAWDRVLVASFSGRRQRRTASLLTKATAHSPGALGSAGIYIAFLLGWNGLGRLLARRFDAMQLPVRSLFMNFGSKPFIEFAHQIGLMIHFWTINSPEQMKQLVSLGADGVVTDRADLAVATLR